MTQIEPSWWSLVLLGAAGGILSGALGIGSGTLFIPVLVLMFGFAQKSAQGLSLAVIVPMALVGAVRYKLNPDVRMDTLWIALLAIGAVLGALVGAELALRLPGHVLRKIFAIYIIAAGVKMLWSSPKPADLSPSANITGIQSPAKEITHARH